ncbi:tetratricopeptide repeat protein [Providencia stuartii]
MKKTIFLLFLGMLPVVVSAASCEVPDHDLCIKIEQGNATAQYRLGTMYQYGEGVIQDYQKARQWYEKAAKQNNADAQYKLGVMFSHGWGGEQDDQQARLWYLKSAQQGNSSAQSNLG